jgi:hypothetical protein
VPTADAVAPAADAPSREVRGDHARRGTSSTALITVPLKGRRRAHWRVLVEGVRLEPGSELELLERADEMGRQLAARWKRVLLDDVLRSRQELDNTFNSLADLVVVCNQRRPRGAREQDVQRPHGKPRDEIIDQPLDTTGGARHTGIAGARAGTPTARRWDRRRAELRGPALKGTFLMTVTAVMDEGQRPARVLVARDVTPHAQLEAERAELGTSWCSRRSWRRWASSCGHRARAQ